MATVRSVPPALASPGMSPTGQPPAPETPPGVLLVRHGQSEWNAVRRWQGSADIALTELGRAQAEALGRALATGHEATTGVEFAAVWSSDLQRASATAAIIAAHLGIGTVHVDRRLREAHAGSWQGLTPDEIELRWPGYLARHRRPDDFERAEDVVARAMAACGELLAGLDHGQHAGTHDGAAAGDGAAGRHVIAVTHSGVIRALCRHLGAVDDRVPNLGGVWIHHADDRALALGRRLRPVADARVDATVGFDGPGEDPGDEADDSDSERGAEGGAAR
jgi:broad specificity phosphatase PhoE